MPFVGDGVFRFINVGSETLLAASRTQPEVVDTIPFAERKDDSCHWHLLDAKTRERVRVLYDSGLSIMPLEISGTPPSPPSQSSALRTGTASTETRLAMLKSVRHEHKHMRAVLLDESQVLVAAPKSIQGWGDGNPWVKEWKSVANTGKPPPEDGPRVEEVD